MHRSLTTLAVVVCAFVCVPVHAQTPAPADDSALNVVQPDFTTINLPTTLRLPSHKSAFRVTHRFGRSLTRGDFGQAAGSFFGIDDGAQIGFEYRYGVMPGLQAGIYRTSDKTIEFFGQYDVLKQTAAMPAGVDVVATIEGLNNFHKGALVAEEDNEYASSVGVVISRTISDIAAFYVQPTYVAHSNILSTAGCLEHAEHGHVLPDCETAATVGIESNTTLVGLSTRVRVRPTVYLVASWSPRLAGFRPGSALGSFGIEKRVGGHMFQLNFSNSLGTTMGQTARGASNTSDWFMGFNLTRKFF